MKFKLYFTLLIILILLLPINPCFAKHIKKIEDMTSDELIEYGRQLEKEEIEREESKQQIQMDVNKKFNDNTKKKKIIKYIPTFIACILILIFITFILLTHKKQSINRL